MPSNDTLENWLEWHRVCDLDKCTPETQQNLSEYGKYHLIRSAKSELRLTDSRFSEATELVNADNEQSREIAWAYIENYLLTKRNSNGQTYKTYICDNAVANGEHSHASFRAGLNILIRSIVRYWWKEEYSQAKKEERRGWDKKLSYDALVEKRREAAIGGGADAEAEQDEAFGTLGTRLPGLSVPEDADPLSMDEDSNVAGSEEDTSAYEQQVEDYLAAAAPEPVDAEMEKAIDEIAEENATRIWNKMNDEERLLLWAVFRNVSVSCPEIFERIGCVSSTAYLHKIKLLEKLKKDLTESVKGSPASKAVFLKAAMKQLIERIKKWEKSENLDPKVFSNADREKENVTVAFSEDSDQEK